MKERAFSLRTSAHLALLKKALTPLQGRVVTSYGIGELYSAEVKKKGFDRMSVSYIIKILTRPYHDQTGETVFQLVKQSYRKYLVSVEKRHSLPEGSYDGNRVAITKPITAIGELDTANDHEALETRVGILTKEVKETIKLSEMLGRLKGIERRLSITVNFMGKNFEHASNSLEYIRELISSFEGKQ